MLTDFAPHKPVAIPDDDTTTFHYFFDSMARRRCYIAPERFYTSGRKLKSAKASASLDKADNEDEDADVLPPPASDKKPELTLTPAMDVFSLGCTIAEVLLDGECLVDLPTLLQYISMCRRKKDGAPNTCLSDDDSPALTTLNRIKDPRIRKTISLMTQFDPSDRLSVFSYRHILEDKGVFPSFFGGVLYDLFVKLHWHGTNPDDWVNIICENYRVVMDEVADCEDEEGSLFFTTALKFLHRGGGTSASATSHLMLDKAIALQQSLPTPSLSSLAADFECTRKSKLLDGADALPRPLHSTRVDLPPGLREAANRGDRSRETAHASADLLGNMKDTTADGTGSSLMNLINDFEKLLRTECGVKKGGASVQEDCVEEEREKEGGGEQRQGQGQRPQKARYQDRVFMDDGTKLFDFQELSERRPK